MNNKTSKRTIGSVVEIWSKNSFLSTLFALLVMILIQAAVQGFNAGSFTGMFGKMWIAWLNILRNNAYAGVIALGMCFAIITGGIDLSVGSVLSLSAIFTAITLKQGAPVWVGISVGLLSGVLMGLINGCLIHFTGINAFIITLGTSFLYRGLALIVTRGTPVSKMPAAFRTFGCGDILHIESGVYMALAALLIAFPLLYKMRWGHYITTLGGNPQALRRCGATLEGEDAPAPGGDLTKADMMDKGLVGPNSAARRQQMLRDLGLPEHLTANGLLEALNLLLTREEFEKL